MKKYIKKTGNFIKKYPMTAFCISLAILLIIIIIGNKIREVKGAEEIEVELTKKVSTIQIKDKQYVNLSGQVEKDGVVTIFSQISGVINKVYVEEGSEINQGKSIVYIADNYSGGNSASVSYEMANRQAQTQDETLEKQLDAIDYQKKIANKIDGKEGKIARRQATIQKRNTEMQYDLTMLQKKQSAINVSYHTPTSPFTGTVERVFVKKGETVNAGNKIAVINSNEKELGVAVNISASLASVIDVESPSILNIDDEKIEVLPTYLSKSEIDNQSYVVIYELEDNYIDKVANNEFIDISIPVNAQVSENEIIIPLDAVRLMNDKSVVFILEDGVAKSREVTTGDVMGNFIVVHGGVGEDDLIILDRNVFDGDRVEVKNL